MNFQELMQEEFPAISFEKHGVKVEVSWIGEGISGDYDPDDPADKPLLRFDIYSRRDRGSEATVGEWEQVEDASYCTQMPAMLLFTHREEMLAWAESVWDEVWEAITSGDSVKRTCESLSWDGVEQFPGRYCRIISCKFHRR